MKIWPIFLTMMAFAAHAVAAPDRCGLLTQDEASKALGVPLKAGYAAGPQDLACQWDGNAGNIYLQVQVIEDPRYWEPHRHAPSYKKISGVGKDAYTELVLGGFVAGTLTDNQVVVVVSQSGGNASAENALVLLKKIVARGL